MKKKKVTKKVVAAPPQKPQKLHLVQLRIDSKLFKGMQKRGKARGIPQVAVYIRMLIMDDLQTAMLEQAAIKKTMDGGI